MSSSELHPETVTPNYNLKLHVEPETSRISAAIIDPDLDANDDSVLTAAQMIMIYQAQKLKYLKMMHGYGWMWNTKRIMALVKM